MGTNRDHIRQKILRQAIELSAFDGWNATLLINASIKAGYAGLEAERVFPGGLNELIELFITQADEAMAGTVRRNDKFPQMKIREKIAYAVRTRLEQQSPHKESIRRAVAYTMLPQHSALALKTLYHTVDTIWRLAGDTSTDFNFYTKRMLLAKVYSATLFYWLDDASAQHQDTWDFLDRQIAGVLAFGKWKAETEAKFNKTLGTLQRAWRDWQPKRA